MAHVLLIHNPDAGHNQPNTAELIRLIESAGHHVIYQSTRVYDFAHALDLPHDLLVIAGGDGPVTKTLKHCAGRSTPISLLPLGTANNIATGLGHTGEVRDLVSRWDLRKHRPFHLGRVRGDWGVSRFAESCGIGALAQAIADNVDEKDESCSSRSEKLKTLIATVRRTIHRLSPERMTIEIDGETLTGDFLWVEITTVGLVGPGLLMANEPEPWRPKLEVAVLPVDERDTALKHLDAEVCRVPVPGCIMRSATRLRITWKNFRTHIDGVNLPASSPKDGRDHHIELSVHDAPVNILTLE